MKSGIIFGVLGILFVNQCVSLRTDQKSNSLAGAYFTSVGTYNLVDTRDDTFLTSYTLTGLENALTNAKKDHKMRYMDETEELESNLNAIYRVCKKNRANYLPYGTSSIPESQLRNKVDKALSDSNVILSDLTSLSSKNYTDKFGIKAKMNKTDKYNGYNYLYPTYVQDFEVAKKYINFTFEVQKLSHSAVVVNVRMAVPVLVKAELHRINYVPRGNSKTKTYEFLRDQSIGSVAVNKEYSGYRSYNNYGDFYLIKDIDRCEIMNETFLCDPSLTAKSSESGTCTALLFKSDCDWDNNYYCEQVRKQCLYEESSSRYKEFTYLGDNKFFVLMDREANYIYNCENRNQEEGLMVFKSYGDHRYTGTIEIEENCTLTTAYATISNQNGVYDIKEVDNEDMIWADVPKIIGVPIWIFAISVAVVALIVFMLLTTWICICCRRCKAKKAAQYATLSG
ncbi:hypothetical protein ACFFRR_006107 [Megaselia abdita]